MPRDVYTSVVANNFIIRVINISCKKTWAEVKTIVLIASNFNLCLASPVKLICIATAKLAAMQIATPAYVSEHTLTFACMHACMHACFRDFKMR